VRVAFRQKILYSFSGVPIENTGQGISQLGDVRIVQRATIRITGSRNKFHPVNMELVYRYRLTRLYISNSGAHMSNGEGRLGKPTQIEVQSVDSEGQAVHGRDDCIELIFRRVLDTNRNCASFSNRQGREASPVSGKAIIERAAVYHNNRALGSNALRLDNSVICDDPEFKLRNSGQRQVALPRMPEHANALHYAIKHLAMISHKSSERFHAPLRAFNGF